ncbi:hypothetical protein NC652_024356 [Populus alba x Populus x berolinensis]|nr:hypothetical protein NC652_024356 [Populus alba x Populus x berolinensis]
MAARWPAEKRDTASGSIPLMISIIIAFSGLILQIIFLRGKHFHLERIYGRRFPSLPSQCPAMQRYGMGLIGPTNGGKYRIELQIRVGPLMSLNFPTLVLHGCVLSILWSSFQDAIIQRVLRRSPTGVNPVPEILRWRALGQVL